MATAGSRSLAVVALFAVASLVVTLVLAPPVSAGPAAPAPGTTPARDVLAQVDDLGDESGSTVVVPSDDAPIEPPPGLPADADPETTARGFLDALRPVVGVSGSTRELRPAGTADSEDGGHLVRFQQIVAGVPVYAGELVVALDADGALVSVTGETARDLRDPSFTVSDRDAARTARAVAERRSDLASSALTTGAPVAYVYDPVLVGEPDSGPRAVWQVVTSGPPASGVSVEVLVDARTGRTAAVFARTPHLSRSVCDNQSDRYSTVAVGYWCSASTMPGRHYTAAVGSPAVNRAYGAMGVTADFYAEVLGVDLTRLIGLDTGNPYSERTDPVLTTTVNFCEPASPCPYANAFWADANPQFTPGPGRVYPGGQTFFGGGVERAEDVIAHELTHGVTSATNGLKYLNESGAINESMSDVFGQLAQVYDAGSNSFSSAGDPAWLVGEQLTGYPFYGAIRSMASPGSTSLPRAYRQPDRMNSKLWYAGREDNGGVHVNNGVGNKAAYLIARGGTYRGVRVVGIGERETARLYWRVQRTLSSGASYRDLAATLSVACSALYGSGSSRCSTVRTATSLTEMASSTMLVRASRSKVTRGKKVKVTAQLRSSRGTQMRVAKSQNARITLQRRKAFTKRWYTVGTKRVTVRGKASWRVKPQVSTRYRAKYSGSAGLGLRGATGVDRVKVRSKVTRTVSARAVAPGRAVVVRGAVRPGGKGKLVRLQRKSAGRWRTVDTDRLGRASRYVFRYRPTAASARYRVLKAAQKRLDAGASKTIRLRLG